MNAGMLRVRTNSMAASVARQVHTWLPRSTHGFSDCAMRSASCSTAAGSPADFVEAR
jgi:hypothetical protein